MDHRVIDDSDPGTLRIRPHPAGVVFLQALLALFGAWILYGLLSYLISGGPSPLILIIPIGLGLVYRKRLRVIDRTIELHKGSDVILIPGVAPVKVSEVKTLYAVEWVRWGAHPIDVYELNLETTDGRQENLLATPHAASFTSESEQLSKWFDLPIERD